MYDKIYYKLKKKKKSNLGGKKNSECFKDKSVIAQLETEFLLVGI